MRANEYGEIARDYRGWALGACWLNKDTQLFQQPVVEGHEGPGDPFQMAVNPRHITSRRGAPLAGVVDGCNALAAGGGRWMRRYDKHAVPLSGSQVWAPGNGRVGDIDRDGNALMLSEDARTMYFGRDEVRREDVQGDTRYMDRLACWTAGGVVHVYDALSGMFRPVQQVGPGAAKALAFRASDGSVWVVYQTDVIGGVCHPIDDETQGYRYRPGRIGPDTDGIYDPDVLVTTDNRAAIYWAALEGQRPDDIRTLTTPVLGTGMVSLLPDEGQPIPVPPVPVPPPPPPVETLAVTITDYLTEGVAPLCVWADVVVTGHRGAVEVWLTLNGQQLAGIDAPTGRIESEIREPGEYRLGAIVRSGDRTSQTGAVRIVRVRPAEQPPTPVEPIKTGREGFTQAADEARRELEQD